MKTIHIFYNGNEANFPENNDWEKFTGHDSVRMFLACAESWRRQGWNVKRLQTVHAVYDFDSNAPDAKTLYSYERFNFTGRIAREGKWYPDSNWQFIAKARTIEPDANGEIWFGTYDVFNFGYYPSNDEIFRLWDHESTGCISFQREHFSLACFVCRKSWLDRAAEILADYDSGKLARISGKYTSDETILRHYSEHVSCPLQAFPLGDAGPTSQLRTFPLLHFARSTLRCAYDSIPVT